MTSIHPGIYPCMVLTETGPQPHCCQWDGERWNWWSETFGPPCWEPVTDCNCAVIAWELPMQHSDSISQGLGDVLKERRHQSLKWGGPEHDDEHTEYDWQAYIAERLDHDTGPSAEPYRHRMVEIAALAIAALESFDRDAARAQPK